MEVTILDLPANEMEQAQAWKLDGFDPMRLPRPLLESMTAQFEKISQQLIGKVVPKEADPSSHMNVHSRRL